MYSQLYIAREAACERYQRMESQRMYRQLIASRRARRKAARAHARARLAVLAIR